MNIELRLNFWEQSDYFSHQAHCLTTVQTPFSSQYFIYRTHFILFYYYFILFYFKSLLMLVLLFYGYLLT